MTLVSVALEEYPLFSKEGGKVEQNPQDWWLALCKATHQVMKKVGACPSDVISMTFCTQMQAFVPVDKAGNALTPAMSYMDMRGAHLMKGVMQAGWPRFCGLNVSKVLKCLYKTGVAPISSKDPVWKYLWFKHHCPELYKKLYKWYDVKEYLLHRATGSAKMSFDSAFGTLLLGSGREKNTWSKSVINLLGVDINHMPALCQSTEVIGNLQVAAAKELGLTTDTKVFAGGGDATLTTIGAGCVKPGDTHIYVGTSGWVSTLTQNRTTDVFNRVASVTGAQPDVYNYFAEQETSGACLKWVRDHLALDEVTVFLNDLSEDDMAKKTHLLYEYMNQIVEETPVSAKGVIFTPWLRGNRCPFEDENVQGMFFNLGINTGKRMLIRAVLEGVAFHKRWMLDVIKKKVNVSDDIIFVGGGAKSKVWGQILADVLQRQIKVPYDPQCAGALGGAVVCAIGSGLVNSYEQAAKLINIENTFKPQPDNKIIYDKIFYVFKRLYKNNRKMFELLNKDVS